MWDDRCAVTIDDLSGTSVSTDQLEVFLVLADELHFGRTATRLHLSQPQVSRLIAGLERLVGGRLFDRTSRSVRLTPLGRQLQERVRPHYDGIIAAMAEARDAVRRTAGTLVLGFTSTTEGEPLQRLVRAFETAHPDCQVVFDEIAAVGPHWDRLRSGDVDVMVNWLLIDEPDLTAGPAIHHDPRVVAVAADHLMAGARSVSIEDLADHEDAFNESTPRAIMEGFLPPTTPLGRPLRRSVPVGGMRALWANVAAGRIVHATVDSLRHQVTRDDIVFVPIHDLPPLPLGLVWCTAHENARIRALAQVARTLHGRTAAAVE
jgi:DNA-binding transcriptional LysR family regulator